jgi:hypothetical protein
VIRKTPKQPRRPRPRPSRVVWELYDPWDGMMLLRVDAPYERHRSHAKEIMEAPAYFKGLRRPDGTPIGLRQLKTRTRLVYP